MPGKYTPLEKYLADLPAPTHDLTLTFEQIERILNDKLPPSAYQHRAWWSNERNGQHVHAHAWMNTGWKVEPVDQKAKWVRFRRA